MKEKMTIDGLVNNILNECGITDYEVFLRIHKKVKPVVAQYCRQCCDYTAEHCQGMFRVYPKDVQE